MTARSHRMRAAGAVPAVLLRVLLVLVGAAGVWLLNPFPVWRGVAIAGLIVGAALPRSLTAWAAPACAALGLILAEPSLDRTALAVLVVHAVHVLAALSLVIPAIGWVAPSALLPTLRRFVLVQAIAQALAFGLGLLAGAADQGMGWLAPVGAVALAALAFATHRVR